MGLPLWASASKSGKSTTQQKQYSFFLIKPNRSPKLTRKEGNITREVSWVWDVPLNESNQDLRVNFLEYKQYDAEGKCRVHFTWITDMRDFAEMNGVWDAWVSPGNTPARACVESRLALQHFNVEIGVIAAR